MLKGDLSSTPLIPLLLQLAEDDSTGCLHISDADADEALIYFKAGLIYAVSVPGRRPQLGAKLVSSGALAPEALADALEAQRTELQGWRLGELLVHLGYVDQPVCEAFVKEQVQDSIWDLIRWTEGKWRFRKNEKTREDVAPPMTVTDLLSSLQERGVEWETISTIVHGPTAVPVLSTRGGGAPETTLDPDAWSMLCKIDGERTVAELARDCGYTLFEAGQVLVALVQAGLVDVEESVDLAPQAETGSGGNDEDDPDALYGATSVSSALVAEAADADPEQDAFAELARLVTEVAATVRDDEAVAAGEVAASAAPDEMSQMTLRPQDDQSFAAALARVSEALSDVLGPATGSGDPFEIPIGLRSTRSRPKPAKPEITPETERRNRIRAAAAAELAAAHALAEALRSAQAEESNAPVEEATFAEVVDLAVVRREAEEAARVEADRLAAEQARAEAERVAAEEAARLEAERVAAEEAARLEAERLAAEEAARLEAERLAAEEAARLEAERLAAEEAARVEAERLEAERLAAEEAARQEDERLAMVAAAEDEAWTEYWQREGAAAEQHAERGAAATALLIELHQQPVADIPEQEPYFVAAGETEDGDGEGSEDEPADAVPAYAAMGEMTDTAALLRELSSLGVEDDPSPAPAPARPAAHRPAAAAAADPKKKKKIGLFGL